MHVERHKQTGTHAQTACTWAEVQNVQNVRILNLHYNNDVLNVHRDNSDVQLQKNDLTCFDFHKSSIDAARVQQEN
jgi:hypothetical protein